MEVWHKCCHRHYIDSLWVCAVFYVWFVVIQTGTLMSAASRNMQVFLLADKLRQDRNVNFIYIFIIGSYARYRNQRTTKRYKMLKENTHTHTNYYYY